MKGQMNQSKLRRTPKVFGTSYRPSPTKSNRPLSNTNFKFWRPVILVVGLVMVALLITRLPVFQIKTVTINGLTNAELIGELEALKGKSIFSNQINRTTTKWLNHDQSLSGLACRRGIPDAITCTGKNREGVLIWKQGEKEYWVDGVGRVFASRQASDPTALVVEDRAGEVRVGDDVASQEIVDTYVRLHQRLSERSITIKNFFVADALYQPSVIISAFPGPGGGVIQKDITIQFAATESIDAQVKTLASLLGQRGERVAERIDLRVPGYVYYR